MAPEIAIPPIEIPERERSPVSDNTDDSDIGNFGDVLLGHPIPPGSFVGGRSEEGFVVPGHGGYLEFQAELWIGWTNYPAPYWNEWHCIRGVAGENGKTWFQHWWCGQWV